MAPLVSICIPAYNAERYLQETFACVLRQSYAAWEMIIVENCSTDGSRTLIERLVRDANDPRIRLYTNETHLDMAGNMNRALSLARGEYVKLLCADDTIVPHCLEKQVAALEQHPGAVMAGCSRNITDPKGKTILTRSSFSETRVYSGRIVIERCVRAGTNLIGEPTSVLLRSAVLSGEPHLSPEGRYWVDFELWTRLLMHGDLYYDKEALAQFRLHGGAATRSFQTATADDFLAIGDRAFERLGTQLTRMQRGLIHARIRIAHVLRQLLYRRVARH